MLATLLPITLALWARVIHAQIYFVNPPRFGTEGDFSENVVYRVGENLHVQWSEAPENTGISVLLYQLNATLDGAYMLPGQYLFRTNFPLVAGIMLRDRRPSTNASMADTSVSENVVNTTSYDWTVAVSENLPATLSESNLFYLSIFQEGKTSSDSNSHYFNITDKSTSTSSSTTTTSASTAVTSSTEMASSVVPVTTTSASTTSEPTAAQASSSSDTGMSTGSKIGIGVGIPAAAIIGIGLGWFFFGRRRRQAAKGSGSETDAHGSNASMGPDYRAGSTGVSEYWAPNQYEALKQGQYNPNLYEAGGHPQVFEAGGRPQVFEANGESRTTGPAELYTEPPNPNQHIGHQPGSMRYN